MVGNAWSEYGYLIHTTLNYHPTIYMYSNGYLSITAVSTRTISLMKLGRLLKCQILSRYKCFILNTLYEEEWCPFVWKLTRNDVHRICHFMPMSFLDLFTCMSFQLFVISLHNAPDYMKPWWSSVKMRVSFRQINVLEFFWILESLNRFT